MHAQCVSLQRGLCAHVGLEYRAAIADPRVVAAGLATPVSATGPGKRALRDHVSAALGRRWQDVPKDPIASQNWERERLPAEWRGLLAAEACEEHGVFEPDAVARRVAELRHDSPWLPRVLVVVATTHAWLTKNSGS